MGKRKIFNKLQLFGLNAQTVNIVINQLENKQNSEMEKIRELIENFRNENEYLKKRVEDLKEENQTQLKSKHILEYSLKKSENYINLFHNTSIQEVADLTVIGEKTEALFNEKIQEFDITIKETRLTLDMLLKEVLNRNDKLNERLGSFIERNGSIKFLPYEEEKKDRKSDLNIQPKVDIEYEEVSVKKDLKNESKRREEPMKEEEIKSVFNEVKKENKTDLLEVTEFLESSVNKYHEEFGNKRIEAEKSGINKVVSNEINNIRNKYLIGRMTGADIVDKSGQILVSKNTLINEEIIDRVEREGKLAELIVNMTLPETRL